MKFLDGRDGANYNRSMRAFWKTSHQVVSRIPVIAMLLAMAPPAAAQSIVTLPTRDGVTQSFLLLAPAQRNPAAAAVLTSTLFLAARSGQGLSGFDFTTIKAPVLFVHNVDDACRFTPYSSAKTLEGRFPLITVRGGDSPRCDACEAFSYHGYLGKERETVEAMVNWMLQKPYRSYID